MNVTPPPDRDLTLEPPKVTSVATTARRSAPGLIAHISWADLVHERMLTACIVLALTAVIAPMLVLLGLKNGIVGTLRTRLVNDPRNREIRPTASTSFTQDWFNDMRGRADVAFVTPMTRQISASVNLHRKDRPSRVAADLAPTGPGDVLLLENHSTPPRAGECVLSTAAARKLQCGPGDAVVVTASRQRGGNNEIAETELRVAAVADERATADTTIFVPLAFLEAVEAYKDGRAVPALGWTGEGGAAAPNYDGAIFSVPAPLSRDRELGLIINSGFSEITRMDPSQAAALGFNGKKSEGRVYYLVSTLNDAIEPSYLTSLQRRLPRDGPPLHPWIRDLRGDLLDADGHVIFANLSLQAGQDSRLPGSIPVAPPTPVPAENAAPPTADKLPPIDTGKTSVAPGDTSLSKERSSGVSATPPRASENFQFIPPPPTPIPRAPDPVPRPSAGGEERSFRGGKEHEKPGPSPSKTPKKPFWNFLHMRWEYPPAGDRPEWIQVVNSTPAKETITSIEEQPAAPNSSTPAQTTPAPQTEVSPDAALRILAPSSLHLPIGSQLQIRIAGFDGPLTVPVTVTGNAPTADAALLVPVTAGVLRLARDRGVAFLPAYKTFQLSRRGYAGFRLYARDIDAVEGLVSFFGTKDLAVFTQAARIRDVKELNRYASWILWLIATVGTVGSVAALFASLYAAVERKKRELSVLRLLGLSRLTLVKLPLYQGAVIVTVSVALSFGIFGIASAAIHSVSLNYLESGEQICQLPTSSLLGVWMASLVLAAGAALVASVRIARIEPSDALRDE